MILGVYWFQEIKLLQKNIKFNMKKFIIPQIEVMDINEVFTKPIVIKYDYMVEENFTHYFVSVVSRIISLNKCSVYHNEKEKTMTILKGCY